MKKAVGSAVVNTGQISRRVEQEFLPFVRRPSRYIGGEVNQIKKNLADCEVTVALCFPDVYEVAMSHTGFAIIYDVLNSVAGVAAERAFAPWLDAEKILREKQIPLFTLESKAAVGDFDIVGFSLTNELCYSNVLNMLELAAIPLRSSQRTDAHPLVIAGGPMANCCEPMAEFIDLFVLGEAEQAAVELAELFRKRKKRGTGRADFLLEAAKKFPWAYVPALYKYKYDGDRITSFSPGDAELPLHFCNAVVEDFENAPVPLRPIVPFTEAVQEKVTVEIMRGCPGRCRFCQATFCRRPIRYRSVDKIVEIARQAYHSTGFDTVSLLALSAGQYPQLEQLVARLQDYFQARYVGIALPSLRVDQQLRIIPQLIASVRKPGLTIAVEAASERLRRLINKPLTDADLFAAVQAAYRAGFRRIKLYFIVGLPSETEDDIKRVPRLCFELARQRKDIDGRLAEVNVTVSWLVPKPHTPFAWLPQQPEGYFERAKALILEQKRRLSAKTVQFKFHHIGRSVLESALARGDRRLAEVIETAWRDGARFDPWNECFDYEIWKQAFQQFGMNLEQAAQKAFAQDDILPWEHLGGPAREYLLTHLGEAMGLAGQGL
jgi:radical SAM family uncharacterized protein